jgi:4-aminobutyrate aminotransferase-like enzyme
MDDKHFQILKELGFDDIGPKNMTNEYWKKRGADALAITTQDRDVYGCLDHTRGDGTTIYDIEGNEYLDLTGGVAVRAFGLRYKPYHDFEMRVNDVIRELPGTDFDAIPQTLLFRPAFHGRTGYALSLTSSNSRHKNVFPQGVDVIRIPYPYTYRRPKGMSEEDFHGYIFDTLEYALQVEGNDIAAVVMEPISGEGGLIVPPSEVVQGIYKIAKEHNAFFMSDEVQAGMGRTGKWCAIENHGVVPDYISMGKALGGGYPMGASIGPAPMYSGPARHSETFSAEPKMALVSLWVLKHIEEQGFLKSNVERGAYLVKRLNELKDKHEVVGDVRGIGLMVGMEFVKDKRSKKKAPKLRNQIVKNAVQKQRVWVLGSGQNVMRFTPSYIITNDIIDDAVDRIDKAIAESV